MEGIILIEDFIKIFFQNFFNRSITTQFVNLWLIFPGGYFTVFSRSFHLFRPLVSHYTFPVIQVMWSIDLVRERLRGIFPPIVPCITVGAGDI